MAYSAKLTRLDAVNRIRRAAQEYPVNSLSDGTINDTGIAEACLDECNTMVQIEGQYCNTTVQTRAIDSNGHILLSNNTIHADAHGADAGLNVTVRGSKDNVKLFNLDDNSYVFENDVELEIVEGIPFEELPVHIQYWVVDQAALLYQAQTTGDLNMTQLLANIAANSRSFARANEIRQSDSSILRNASSVYGLGTGGAWNVRKQRFE